MSEKKIAVIFICLGNICRSPAAEEIFRQMTINKKIDLYFKIDSAGMGNWHVGQLPDNRMRAHCAKRGYNIVHRARVIELNDLNYFDYIIAMDNSNYHDIIRMCTTEEQKKKVHLMSSYFRKFNHYSEVPDPYYHGAEGFELVLDLLEDGCDGFIDELKSQFNL